MNFFDILLAKKLGGGSGGGGGIIPTGSISITENGTHNVTQYAEADVNVEPALTTLNATVNGTYNGTTTPIPRPYVGWDEVIVNVTPPVTDVGGWYIYNDADHNNTKTAESWCLSPVKSTFYNVGNSSVRRVLFKNGIVEAPYRIFGNCNLYYVYFAKTVTTIDTAWFGPTFNANLSEVEVESGFDCDLPLQYASALTAESIRAIIANFADNSGKTVTLHATAYARLSSDDFAAATAKGLTIASA